jgi:hypothetical protein
VLAGEPVAAVAADNAYLDEWFKLLRLRVQPTTSKG